VAPDAGSVAVATAGSTWASLGAAPKERVAAAVVVVTVDLRATHDATMDVTRQAAMVSGTGESASGGEGGGRGGGSGKATDEQRGHLPPPPPPPPPPPHMVNGRARGAVGG